MLCRGAFVNEKISPAKERFFTVLKKRSRPAALPGCFFKASARNLEILSCQALYGRLPDLIFAPTPAFIRFSEDLLLRYAMITARSCERLTWIPLPVPGLDFQPQTQTTCSILSQYARKRKLFFVACRPMRRTVAAQTTQCLTDYSFTFPI